MADASFLSCLSKSGMDLDQQSRASGRTTESTETVVQYGLVSTSCAMQEGEKTAVTLLRLLRREEPMSWMRSHWLVEEEEVGEADGTAAMLSAYS